MVEHQGPRRHAVCQILVHGQDISTRLHPYLISVQTVDNLEGGMDTCHLELDDRNAELQIPPDGAELQVCLGWAGEGPRLFESGRGSVDFKNLPKNFLEMTEEQKKQEQPWGGPGLVIVFDGWVTKTESGFGRRGGGRRLWIDGEGANSKGLAKEVIQTSFGEGKQDDSEQGDGKGKIPLKNVLTDVFSKAGMKMVMSPEMEKFARDYWHVNDSPMNLGKRIAQETGGLFKISKNTAILVGKTEGVNASGEKMPTVDAIWGINLIGWRIKPYIGRPQYGATQSKFFDTFKGGWEDVKGMVSGGTPFGGTNAIAHAVNSVSDKATGEQTNKGSSADSETRRGEGWVLINGEPNAKANGFIRIDGARPGVDGTYTMTEVEHNYTRGVGFTTRVNVRSPNGTGGGMEWVQDGDTPEKKAKRDAEYENESSADTRTDERRRQDEGESWSPEDDPNELTPVFTPIVIEPGESWSPEDDPNELTPPFTPGEPPGESWAPTPGDPGGVVRPPISGEQTFTAEELERIRQAGPPSPPISQ